MRPALTALAALLTLAAPAHAEVAKETFRVPVRVADETGPVAIDTDVYLPEGKAPRRGRPLVVVFHGVVESETRRAPERSSHHGWTWTNQLSLARRGLSSTIERRARPSGNITPRSRLRHERHASRQTHLAPHG